MLKKAAADKPAAFFSYCRIGCVSRAGHLTQSLRAAVVNPHAATRPTRAFSQHRAPRRNLAPPVSKPIKKTARPISIFCVYHRYAEEPAPPERTEAPASRRDARA
jgi:hypothetical protein